MRAQTRSRVLDLNGCAGTARARADRRGCCRVRRSRLPWSDVRRVPLVASRFRARRRGAGADCVARPPRLGGIETLARRLHGGSRIPPAQHAQQEVEARGAGARQSRCRRPCGSSSAAAGCWLPTACTSRRGSATRACCASAVLRCPTEGLADRVAPFDALAGDATDRPPQQHSEQEHERDGLAGLNARVAPAGVRDERALPSTSGSASSDPSWGRIARRDRSGAAAQRRERAAAEQQFLSLVRQSRRQHGLVS